MEHIQQVSAQQSRASVDAMLVTSTTNLQYAPGRTVFAGAVLVTKDAGWYVVDGPRFQPRDPSLAVRSGGGKGIPEKAFLEILPDIRSGLTEHDTAGMLTHRMLANGAFTLAFPPIVASGPNGSDPHGFATDRIIQNGGFITMDFGCVMGGYGSDMTRTVAVGQPSDEMRRVYDIVLAAQLAGIQAAHGGITGQEIDAAGRKVIADAGYGEYFIHNFGHGLGVEGHETPGAGQNDIIPLPAGAVVSAEPGIYLPGKFGVRIEDLIVLTEDGCENLNHAPKEWALGRSGRQRPSRLFRSEPPRLLHQMVRRRHGG